MGGGGMLDIGCYCISASRMIFGSEPLRVVARVENDPAFQVDRLASAILEFDAGTATFTCGTQLGAFQKVILLGTEGRLELDTPFSLASEVGTQIWHRRGAEIRELPIEPHNHYTIQGDSFSKAVIENTEVPFPLTDGVANMEVIDAVLRSGKEGSWVPL
jgi:predicted dehydrogenase